MRRDAADDRRTRRSAISRAKRRRRKAERSSKLHALLGAIHESLDIRRRRHAFGDDGGGMFRASQGRLSGFFASLHRLRARDRRAGALCERLFPRQRWRGSGRRPRMGRGLCRGSRLGGLRSRRMASRRRNIMCASPSRSTIWARRRSAARTPAAAAKRWTSKCASRGRRPSASRNRNRSSWSQTPTN